MNFSTIQNFDNSRNDNIKFGDMFDRISENDKEYQPTLGMELSDRIWLASNNPAQINKSVTWSDNFKLWDDDDTTESDYYASKLDRTENVPEEPQQIPETQESNVLTDTLQAAKESDFLNPGSVGAGMVLEQGNRAITESENFGIENAAKQGISAAGHAPDAMLQAQKAENTNNIFSDIRDSEIAIGSAFGPEGLAIGVASALVTQNWFGNSQQADLQGNSGNMIAGSEIAT